MKTIDNFSFERKKILLRVDLNVPVINQKITEKSRIDSLKPSINKLIKRKNKIFLLSHFGRPKGKYVEKYSLKFICPTLVKELGIKKIYFINNLNEKEIKKKIYLMNYGDVCLLENIRFYPGEENNDLNFIKAICKNFDFYINDAFSVSHRNHASIVGPPKFLPSYAGFSLLDEIKNIDSFFHKLTKPNLAIIGGSKISSKINILYNLMKSCNTIVIGGAMANTFFYAKNINIGQSLCEKNLSSVALSIIEKAKKYNCKIILPVDVICANSINDKLNIYECDVRNIPSNLMVLDIGIKTIEIIKRIILKSKMILWNGPLGAFEYIPFNKSSIKIANTIKDHAKNLNIVTLAGGGDTISAIKLAKAEDGFSYLSKAGGAFLEWMEGKESPGVTALKKNNIN